MSTARTFLAGTLAVATAEVLVSSPGVAGRIGAFGDFLTVVIDRVVNPDVPAIGSTNYVPPAPLSFAGGSSQPTQPSQPDLPTQPRTKQLHSTKAKPPRVAPPPRKTPHGA